MFGTMMKNSSTMNNQPSRGIGEGFDYAAPETSNRPQVDKLEVSNSWLGRAITEPKLHGSVIMSSLMINIMALTTPLVILQVYDRILPNQAKATLWMLFMGACGIMLLDLVLKSLRNYYLGHQAANYMHTMSVEGINRILHAPHGMVEKQALSTQMNKFTSLLHVAEFHGSQSRTSAIDMPFVVIFLGLMAAVGGFIVLVPLVLFAVFALISVQMNKKMSAALTERTNLDNRKYDFVIEALSNIFTLKVLGMESAIQRRYERLQQNSAEGTHTLVNSGNNIQDLSVLFGSIAQIAVVAVGAFLTINGNISMGALACCTLLSGQVLQPLLRGIVVWTEHQTLSMRRADAADIFKLPEVHRSEDMGQIAGNIVIRGLTTTSDSAGNSLQSADAVFPMNKIICVHMNHDQMRKDLLRMISGDTLQLSGSVTIGDQTVSASTADALRRQISYVSPQTKMFRGTILENLTHFEISKKRMAALDAVRIMGIENEINQLPDGYDTKLGEGSNFEFGQDFIMKLAIARSLVAVPQVLLLDNVTENMDMVSMNHLGRTLDALRGRMTIIFATGDTRILKSADMLFSINNGKIVQARLSDELKPAQQQQKLSA
jgi:ATP-binding cassette, subfamily C, bacterial LapB